MKKYNFDEIIDRRGTGASKYDFAGSGKPETSIPLWVADMDFRVCDEIIEALKKEAEFGIFGYTGAGEEYFEAVSKWFSSRFSWDVKEEWLVRTPGVVFALSACVRAFTEPRNSVLIQPPVYYPFSNVIRNNGRSIVENPLVLKDGRYEIDFEDMERKIRDYNVKLFILCSPHNPVGRIWTVKELRRMGEICRKYGVIIVADEIHCDFSWPGKKQRMFLEACPEFADMTVSCTAPSKTFNLAGLQTSNIWVPGKKLRVKLQQEMRARGAFTPNQMGLTACTAAYTYGEKWFRQCLKYMQGNLKFLREYLAEKIPEVRLIEPDGTYFAWLDFSALGLDREALDDFVLNKAGIWTDEGHIFGTGGDGFHRIILACPRSMLEQAMEQLEEAVKDLHDQRQRAEAEGPEQASEDQ